MERKRIYRKPRKRPYNRRGKMKEFTPGQIMELATKVRDSGKLHAKRDYALLCVSVDMMARQSDILALKFGDVIRDNGEIVDELQFDQQKTGELATCIFTDETREALADYVGKYAECVRSDKDRLIFGMCSRRYRDLVKEWAVMLDLNPKRYSGHSFRRTKAKMIYAETGDIMAVKKLLGHTSARHTQEYLDVEQSAALDLARRISPLRRKA